jgi:hypothetical protein
MTGRVPHLRVVVAVSCFVLFGFAAVSVYVLRYSDDEVTQGNVIGTWINFAMLAVGFWLGSSSGGKSALPVNAPQSAAEAAHKVADAAVNKADQIDNTLDLTGAELDR